MPLRIDEELFEQTVRAYSADLYRYAYWLCRDRFNAEDLVQETFVRAWKSRHTLREPSATKAWLLTILRNEYARLGSGARLKLVDDLEMEALDLPSSYRPGSDMELEQLVAVLPVTLREPLALQVLGGFGCIEIAAMLGLTVGAVMTRLTRARQALRAHLAAEQLSRGIRAG